MRGRAHSRDEGGFGRVVAASAVLLALLSGIVVMMLGAVGHMARMTSPGLANLGSPAARERHPAERRNSAGGFDPLWSGRRVHRSGGTHDGNDAVGDGSMTLDELRESLGGDVTTDFSWSDGAREASSGTKTRRRWGFGRDEKKRARRSRARADDHLLDVMKRGYREAEENGLGGGRDSQPYDPAKVDAETEYRTRSGRARLETKFIHPRALNFTEDTGRLRRLGRTLYLDGEPWLMRALCYSPIPVGWDPDWFEPYGDFFTSEYAGIYERDIPLIAAAGVNTLRIHTLKHSHRHSHFFDLCQRYGISVVVGYGFEDGTKSFFDTPQSMEETKGKIKSLIRAARHPAVIAWIVGNELNGPWNLFACDKDLAENFGIGKCQFGNSVEKLMKAVDGLCEAVKEEGILCGTALANVNLPATKQHLVGQDTWGAAAWIKASDRYMKHLDFWGVNLYTRRYFAPMGLFQRFHAVSNRPLVITEYGVDAYSLNPKLEGSNGYDTMGEEDEVSQADWLVSMVEDLERHATTCAAGCGERFLSGGAIMSWVDEWWKGKSVTPVPTTDPRVPTVTRVCPSLKEYLHSPCGYASPTQPDLYVNEEWFGLMAVKKRCSINKVDLLRPRAAYFALKMLWADGGSCTPFMTQYPDEIPYDPVEYPDCGRAMKAHVRKTMETFTRVEAQAFHGLDLRPGESIPAHANFENFTAMLHHPPGVINPIESTLQSTFTTCHAMGQIHKVSPRTCPAPPKIAADVVGYVTSESNRFVQPGDTSCPQQEQIDAMKLEVEIHTVLVAFAVSYVVVALMIKRKQLWRWFQDAMVSLARAGFPLAKYLATPASPDEASAKLAASDILASGELRLCAAPEVQLCREPAASSDAEGDGPRLSRPGPPPAGDSDIEKGIDAWRRRIWPIADNIGGMFGFQSRASNADDPDVPGATRELVVDKMAKNLWNMTQLAESPNAGQGADCAKGPSARFAVTKLHERTFAGYERWLEHTKFDDLSPQGAPPTLGSTHVNHANDDRVLINNTRLCQIVLFEMIYVEAANCRLLPEMLSFTYHVAACSVVAPSPTNGGVALALSMNAELSVPGSPGGNTGRGLPEGDFVESVVIPFHGAITESMTLTKRLHARVGYDDINEFFWDKVSMQKMLRSEPTYHGAASAYARYRHFLRTFGAAKHRDGRLAAMFQKTFREHVGWGMVFCNFHRMFTFLSVCFHLLVVHAFAGFSHPHLFFSAGLTAAACNLTLEIHCLFIHEQELLWNRAVSAVRASVAMGLIASSVLVAGGYLSAEAYCLGCAPYLMLSFTEICGEYVTWKPKSKLDLVGKRSRGDLAVDDPSDRRAYVIFWLVILAIKFAMDYVFIVHALVLPSRAIMQIDLFCWNYNFAGEDCDAYDYTDSLPLALIQGLRLFRRYAYKALMLFERWLPNLMLYYCNTFFYYLAVLGFASAFDRLRWRGVADGWSKVIRNLPAKVAAFEARILTKAVSDRVEPSVDTVMCPEAVAEGWGTFSRAWNEVVRSLRDRDLLSDEEVSLLVFRRLRGAAIDAFFAGAPARGGAGAYLMFPSMVTAPVFSKHGASRNVNMDYDMLKSVVNQTVDLVTFVFVSVLGVCDGELRAELADTLKATADLVACAAARRQATAADHLLALRGHALTVFTALKSALAVDKNAPDELRNFIPQAAVVRRAIDSAMRLLLVKLADDRDLEDDTGKECNALLRKLVDRLRAILRLERLDDSDHARNFVAPALATLPGRTAVEHVFVALSTSNPAAEPSSAEARDVLRFFLESFTDPQLTRGAPVARAPSMVTLTPMYKEEVTYSVDDLRTTIDGESVSTLRFIISMMPHEWSAMLQRTKIRLPQQDYDGLLDELSSNRAEDHKTLGEICRWASGRSQTLMRTVRGMASYADATRVLARLEGVPESDIEPLVAAKYNHLVCAQVYGSEGNQEKDDQMDELLMTFPHMSIVTAHFEDEDESTIPEHGIARPEGVRWYMTHRRAAFDARGAPVGIVSSHRIQLPGHAIVGEGKPENQNLGMALATGMYVQTIDMNQDAHLAEALKLRNVLAQFVGNTRLVGFPEQMITDRSGSVASFAALSEQVFGTIVQRFMAKPLNVRFHYGHPDVWDLTWVRGNGGVSKASKQLHLSEDIFGGMNLMLRGGRVKYLGFKMVGKAREVSFDGTNQFNFKISSGNGMQLISRDFHRLAKNLDLFRMLSFFQSSAGIFFTEWMLFASLFAFVVCKLMIAMLHVETFFSAGDAFDSVGFHDEPGTEVLYPSQWMIQATLVMAWPSMLEGWLDGGFAKMFTRFFQHALAGAHVFNMFIAKTRGYAIDHTVTSGKALYQVTRRGMRMRHSFVSLYTRYAVSHITPSAEMAAYVVMLTALSRFGPMYVFVMTTWHVWFAITCLSLAPWLFHPQSFKEGMTWRGFTEWACWLDFGLDGKPRVEGSGSWLVWNQQRLHALRAMPSHAKFDFVLYRVLPVPVFLLMASCAALRIDENIAKPTLRGIFVLTAAVAGIVCSVMCYWATSPSFMWPKRVLNFASRAMPRLTVVDRHCLVLAYGLVVKLALVVFHHVLCAQLFADSIDSTNFANRVVFFCSGFFAVCILVGAASIVGDATRLRGARPVALAVRHFADAMLREVDIVQGLLLHAVLFTISLLPISYLHGKILFNGAYAAVLGVEMRRRRVIASINAASASKTARRRYLRFRNFVRGVLGLRAVTVKFARPAPTCAPGLDDDLCKPGPKIPDERKARVAARLRPIAESLATNFGFQKSCVDSTFTDEPVEVPSNLANSIESLSHWLCNAMDARAEAARGFETEAQFRATVADLHARVFRNYIHWGQYTGMLDRAKATGSLDGSWLDAGAAGARRDRAKEFTLATFMTAEADGLCLWEKGSREHKSAVTHNARLHQLCLWFLLYGESANLRHAPEAMCFIFHAAMCAVTLEDRAPAPCPMTDKEPVGDQLVLAKPVAGCKMPHAKDDYLNSIVRPLYQFLQREIQGRASSPIEDRVMYDDFNEFFWMPERFAAMMPHEDGRVQSEVSVPEEMRPLPMESRMYAHLRAFLQRASSHPQGAAAALSGVFFKTHKEVAGWMSMFVNFNTVFLFHAVAFHLSAAYVFAGNTINWEYVSTAVITHSVVKLLAEVASLHFRNLPKEPGGDVAVTVTRCVAFAVTPLVYFAERWWRGDGHVPYFQALAAVYTLAFAGLASSPVRREPYMGSSTQLATPIKERIVYTLFWITVLSVKLTFGHYLLVSPLREAVMALHHPDLCWNKESDEYTSCIHLEGEALMNALRFTPRQSYFVTGHEHSFSVKMPETPADIETEADADYEAPAVEQQANEPDPIESRIHDLDLSSSHLESGVRLKSRRRSLLSNGFLVTDYQAEAGLDVRNTLDLPQLGMIGREVEGELPEAYYDVHASVELMWIMTAVRALPAVTTYFCDTFLWYTFFATVFTVFLQWRGKITHAQNWAVLLRTFGSVPALFCGKLLNRAWPKPKIIRTEDASEEDASSAVHGSVGIMEPLIGRRDVVLELPRDATGESEDPSDATGADPAGFLTEATDIRWQHFARAWNAIVKDLRARDHLSDSERDDLSFVFLRGEDVEDIFESPEYVVMPAMMTSPVFSTSSLETGGGSEYTSFARTLTQAKDLLCVLLTEVMGVVRPREIHALMRTIAALANIEGEQMAQRRMYDVEGYVRLRDAVAALAAALQSLAAATDATPAENAASVDENIYDDMDDDMDDEDASSAPARTDPRRAAMQLEVKYGCTPFLSKSSKSKARGPEARGEDDEEQRRRRRERRRRRRQRDQREAERRWSRIETPADLMETHGARVSSALRDALLAVRELCSFALEQDARFSSAANQRKYKVSQLYSNLLDAIRADVLRDPEHMRLVAAAATTPLARSVCSCLLRSVNSGNPGGQPRSEEAQRQLMFFCNSLRFTSLRTPTPMAQVQSWTTFTPYYAEDVKYSFSQLTTPLEDEKTLFSLIVATFPSDYENLKERLGVLGADDDAVLRNHWTEAQAWASDRSQSLARCVRGVTLYGSALRLLARLEGHAEDEVEALVRSKYEFLVSAQIFGTQRSARPGTLERFKAQAIEELIVSNRDLRVCFVHVPEDPSVEDYASCLIGVDESTGKCKIDYRVKLPGNPVIGEGKPENQNHAVIFARGAHLQTLDMNQDNYMGEAYKMRNLLDSFKSDGVVLVGFPETIFSETHGAVAQFAAIAEFIFQTFQRLMTWPLMVRFHYGHPDVWDKAFTMTNGGVSKASRALHVAEDLFGGVNAVARGGKVIFEEFIECGKGRDMGFTSVNGFEQKISGSSGTISMSRDLYRLHKGMDALRVFSLYFSGPGFFISMMQTAWCVYLYILAHAALAVADLEIYRVYRYFKMTETQTSLSLSREEGGYYNSIYAIQLGFLSVLPLFLKMCVDRGVRDGFNYVVSTLVQGSWAFNIFTMTTKGYNYMRALLFGQAQYIATERGYVLMNASMVVLYGLYAKSHLYQGMELLVYLVLFHLNTQLPVSFLYSWSVWMFALCVVIAPWWFSPQATNLFWMRHSWLDWRRWIDGNFNQPRVSHGSWASWHAHMMANWREMLSPWYKALTVCTSGAGRIILTLVCVASLNNGAQTRGVEQRHQFGHNAGRMAVAASFTMVVAAIYYLAMRSETLARGRWLAFPEQLWKLSVYRGLARVATALVWVGCYAVFSYDESFHSKQDASRTFVMTILGCVAIASLLIESWVMIGNRDVEHVFDWLMPRPSAHGESHWRYVFAKPLVMLLRHALLRLRNFADFWYCEMDKACGAVIFALLFALSLLPVASLQSALVWNETFGELVRKRVEVERTVNDVIG